MRKHSGVKILSIVTAVTLMISAVQGSTAYAETASSGNAVSWDLSELFANDAAFQAEAQDATDNALPAFNNLIQEVKDPASLKAALEAYDVLDRRDNILYTYAQQKADLDTADSEAAAELKVSYDFNDRFSLSDTAFRNLLLSKDETFWDTALSDSSLAPWRRFLQKIKDEAEYTLPENEEAMLIPASQAANSLQNTASVLRDGDIEKPVIKDPDGNDVTVDYGHYSIAMTNPDRDYRKRYYEAYMGTYAKYRDTFAQILNGYTTAREKLSTMHHYASRLDETTHNNETSVEIYNALISGARSGADVLKRDSGIRKKALGLDKLYSYDSRLPIGKATAPVISYADAQGIVKNALAPLGEDYVSTLDTAFQNGWIDVYPQENKNSGAYSSGTAYPHPWVLMNYTDDYYSMSTLAHELGHAIHDLRSSEAQESGFNKGTTSFNSEVASTTNELLLSRYMIDHAASNSEKLYYVQQELETLNSTFYGQILFADFEKRFHDLSAGGGALTADALDRMYIDTVKTYSTYETEDKAASYWGAVPHFYYNYYVYSYSMDICIACRVAEKITAGDKEELENYRNFLSAGKSLPTVELYKLLGVDITGPDYIKALTGRYSELLDMEEQLLKAEQE